MAGENPGGATSTGAIVATGAAGAVLAVVVSFGLVSALSQPGSENDSSIENYGTTTQ